MSCHLLDQEAKFRVRAKVYALLDLPRAMRGSPGLRATWTVGDKWGAGPGEAFWNLT